jgi:hypothetical protein
MQILICHACYLQEVHIQSRTWCNVAPNYFKLAGADGVRALKDAPAPNAGTAHSIANSVSFLNSMMNIDSKSDYTESAYSASSDSGSSEERGKSREHKNKKAKKSNVDIGLVEKPFQHACL